MCTFADFLHRLLVKRRQQAFKIHLLHSAKSNLSSKIHLMKYTVLREESQATGVHFLQY